MNLKNELTEPEDSIEMVEEDDDSSSVEDFIKELEAKEKDLHITADYKIEISDSDFEMVIPQFIQEDLPPVSKPEMPSAPAPGMKTRVYELENELESLKKKMADLRSERNDVQEKSDRRLKDFENFKYRIDRERRGAFINQIGNLATQMLPVLDNLDRALDSIAEVPAKKRNEFKQFFDGVGLVNQQINEVLSGMGVQPIATVGEEFDPNFHEAVATEETTDLPPNTVSGEMLRGYRIGNMVIRHSMVRVTTAPQPADSKKARTKKDAPDDTPVAPIPEPADLLP